VKIRRLGEKLKKKKREREKEKEKQCMYVWGGGISAPTSGHKLKFKCLTGRHVEVTWQSVE
jgi:hypothetical protein